MHPSQPIKTFWFIGIVILLSLSTLSCSVLARLGDQTEKTWSIDREGLRSLFDSAIQGTSEADRILLSVDRLEFSENGGLKAYGPCPFENSPAPEGYFTIAFITEDSRLRMEIGVRSICGIQQDDPRVSVLNDQLNRALEEKIAAECGNVLVNRVNLSANRLTIWYLEA
jgi:hypothetical protein